MFNVNNPTEFDAFSVRLTEFLKSEGFHKIEITREFGGASSHPNNVMAREGVSGIAKQRLIFNVDVTYDTDPEFEEG